MCWRQCFIKWQAYHRNEPSAAGGVSEERRCISLMKENRRTTVNIGIMK
jgi:hypothetical protein